MIILAIESSCDETAAALVRDGREVLADEIYSQVAMHAEYGGVVPELASRSHVEVISGLADSALKKAGLSRRDIDAVAVTYAPGLIGALLVGLNFAKSVSLALGVPLIPVHHIRGHIAANYVAYPELKPPFMAMVVSGGHSLLIDVADYTKMKILGSTRDDAAGECFDKAARVMGAGYPGGAVIDRLSQTGDAEKYHLPRAKVEDHPLDFSFSGLKTAVINAAHNAAQKNEELDRPSLAASFSAAVCDTLVPRAMLAADMAGRDTIVCAGGVAANSRIRAELARLSSAAGKRLFLAPLPLCGDNGSIIGSQGYYEFLAGNLAGPELNAYATMDVDSIYF